MSCGARVIPPCLGWEVQWVRCAECYDDLAPDLPGVRNQIRAEVFVDVNTATQAGL